MGKIDTTLQKIGIKVGLFGDIAKIARWNGEGTRTIPARDFLHFYEKNLNALTKNQGKYVAKAIMQGKNYDHILRELGEVAESIIRQAIWNIQDPPNAPSTISKKGFNNPLIDTGEMVRSVQWRRSE